MLLLIKRARLEKIRHSAKSILLYDARSKHSTLQLHSLRLHTSKSSQLVIFTFDTRSLPARILYFFHIKYYIDFFMFD